MYEDEVARVVGHGGPGFVWAGIVDTKGSWDPQHIYLIPLIKNAKNKYEAVLPKGINVFTFFWIGTDSNKQRTIPGVWEGKNFLIKFIEKKQQTPISAIAVTGAAVVAPAPTNTGLVYDAIWDGKSPGIKGALEHEKGKSIRAIVFNESGNSDVSQILSPTTALSTTTANLLIAQNEAKIIHDENLKCAPNIPQNTILCHIIIDSILPIGQRNILKVLEKNMRGSEYNEKVVSLSIQDPNKFIEELSALMVKQKELYKNYTVQFDIACPNTALVSAIFESSLGVRALAFEPCKESEVDVAQVEGIILALRALNSGKLENLQEAFKMLSGKDLPRELSGIADIDEFIKRITFILPVAGLIDYNHIRQLNEIIRKNIESAA